MVDGANGKRLLLMILAVLIAALIGALGAAVLDPDFATFNQVAFTTIFFGFFGLLHAGLFGVPLHYLLRGRMRWTFIRVTACGALSVGGPWLIGFGSIWWSEGSINRPQIEGLALVTLLGAVGGAVYWGLLNSFRCLPELRTREGFLNA